MNTKIALAIAMTGVMVAVALVPLVTSADAARTTTCSQGPPGPCSGNSDENNKNRCETTRTGQGGGSGTIKDTTC